MRACVRAGVPSRLIAFVRVAMLACTSNGRVAMVCFCGVVQPASLALAVAPFAKDIVIVVDDLNLLSFSAGIPGSSRSRYSIVQEAVVALLTTASPRDRVTVIMPSSPDTRCKLRVGVPSAVDALTQAVLQSSPKSSISRWTDAWDAVDRVLSHGGRVTATTLLVVVSGGDSISDEQRVRASQLVATYSATRPVQAFTFCVSCAGVVHDFMSQLANSTGGSFWPGSDVTTLPRDMSSIHSAARAATAVNATVAWTRSVDWTNTTVARVGMRVASRATGSVMGTAWLDASLLDLLGGVALGPLLGAAQLSYGFVVDSDSVVWTHPALSLPSLNDTSPPRTALLESVEPVFHASAWERLHRRENGTVDLTVSIVCMTHARRVCGDDLALWAWCATAACRSRGRCRRVDPRRV